MQKIRAETRELHQRTEDLFVKVIFKGLAGSPYITQYYLFSLGAVISAYQKLCDFLISHLYATCFGKMSGLRYSKYRNLLKIQREQAEELKKSMKTEV